VWIILRVWGAWLIFILTPVIFDGYSGGMEKLDNHRAFRKKFKRSWRAKELQEEAMAARTEQPTEDMGWDEIPLTKTPNGKGWNDRFDKRTLRDD